VENFDADTTVLRGDVCTYYYGSNTSITVDGPGSFVVTTSVEMAVDHTNGVTDAGYISLVNTSAACDPTATGNNFDQVLFPAGLSSDVYVLSYALTQTLQVGAAGTYSVGIIGDQNTGTDPIDFDYASLVVTFFPE